MCNAHFRKTVRLPLFKNCITVIKEKIGRDIYCLGIYRMMLKELSFCGIIVIRNCMSVSYKEIDHEKTDTDIAVRTPVYGLCVIQ